jgi:hypothetical protein
MNSFTKQPNEIIPISIDYVDVLDTNETIAALSVKVYDPSLSDLTSTMLFASSIDDTLCKASLQSGTSGNEYKVTFKVTTNTGSIYEEEVFMKVREV